MDPSSFERDQSHANLEIIRDAACNHVNGLSKPGRAIKDQSKVLLHQFLYHPLDLAIFDLLNKRLRLQA
jgi:hypothetical protein